MYQEGREVGSYRLQELLEHGTIADAYLATYIAHPSTNRPVIVKIFQETMSEEELAQYIAYIRACALLEDPNILRVLDFGEQVRADSHTPFFVIEIPGETLRQRHPQGQQVPLDTIAFYVSQIASALQFAHNQRVLHLNLRPEQLFVGSDGRIILDYTNRLLYSVDPTFIPTDTLYTPHEAASPASDQYALAMIIYEWLSGMLPFSDEAAGKQRIVPMPGEYVFHTWARVEQVLSRALAPNPAQRYEHIRAFADAFILALNVGPEAARIKQEIQRQRSSSNSVSFATGMISSMTTGDQQNWPNPFSSGFIYQTCTVHILTFSPDSKQLAFSSYEPAIYIAEVTGQGTLFTYQGHTDRVWAVTWSPDGQTIASLGSNETTSEIQIWEAATGKLLSTYQVNPHTRELQWSPDGKFLATGGRNSPIQIWQLSTGTILLTYNGHASPSLSAIAWSPDSTRIASASGSEIQVWEVATETLICIYRGHLGGIQAVAWSPDGTTVASGGDDMTIQVWNASSRAPISIHRLYSSMIMVIGWSPDGKYIITGTRDNNIQAYNAQDGENVFHYHSHVMHTEHIGSAAWSPDLNILAVGREDRRVEVANRATGKVLLCRAPAALIEEIGQGRVSQGEMMTTTNSTSFSNEQTTTTTTTITTTPPFGPPVIHTTMKQRRAVRAWGGKDARDIVTYYGHKSAVKTLVWSPDGSKIASGGYDGTIHVWDAVTSNTIFIYRGHLDPVVTVAWSPDGTRLASGSLDQTVKIWDQLTGREILTYRGHTNFVQAVAWSPDSTRVVSGSDDHTVQVWDASSSKTILSYIEHTAGINSVSWSVGGQLIASGSEDQTVHIWEAASGNTVFVYRKHTTAVLAVGWSPDGTRVASSSAYRWRGHEESIDGSDQEAAFHIWTTTPEQAATIYGQDEHPEIHHNMGSITWSPDGQMIATQGGYEVRIYDASTGEAMAIIRDHHQSGQPDRLLTVAWSPDGTRIAGSLSNGRVQVWPARAQSG